MKCASTTLFKDSNYSRYTFRLLWAISFTLRILLPGLKGPSRRPSLRFFFKKRIIIFRKKKKKVEEGELWHRRSRRRQNPLGIGGSSSSGCYGCCCRHSVFSPGSSHKSVTLVRSSPQSPEWKAPRRFVSALTTHRVESLSSSSCPSPCAASSRVDFIRPSTSQFRHDLTSCQLLVQLLLLLPSSKWNRPEVDPYTTCFLFFSFLFIFLVFISSYVGQLLVRAFSWFWQSIWNFSTNFFFRRWKLSRLFVFFFF